MSVISDNKTQSKSKRKKGIIEDSYSEEDSPPSTRKQPGRELILVQTIVVNTDQPKQQTAPVKDERTRIINDDETPKVTIIGKIEPKVTEVDTFELTQPNIKEEVKADPVQNFMDGLESSLEESKNDK